MRAPGSRKSDGARGLDLARRRRDESPMPDRRDKKRRPAAPRMSYTTKVHMRRRLAAIDFRFIAAVIALIVAALLIVRYA